MILVKLFENTGSDKEGYVCYIRAECNGNLQEQGLINYRLHWSLHIFIHPFLFFFPVKSWKIFCIFLLENTKSPHDGQSA